MPERTPERTLQVMRITLNGESHEIRERQTVAELLEELRGQGLPAGACAVEVNRQLIPRRDHTQCQLADGDSVEIVTLVGGG